MNVLAGAKECPAPLAGRLSDCISDERHGRAREPAHRCRSSPYRRDGCRPARRLNPRSGRSAPNRHLVGRGLRRRSGRTGRSPRAFRQNPAGGFGGPIISSRLGSSAPRSRSQAAASSRSAQASSAAIMLRVRDLLAAWRRAVAWQRRSDGLGIASSCLENARGDRLSPGSPETAICEPLVSRRSCRAPPAPPYFAWLTRT
jgi:hypothetical protein